MNDAKHRPTSPANREAVLRFQAEQLLRDAAAWGYRVCITLAEGPGDEVHQTIRILKAIPPYAESP